MLFPLFPWFYFFVFLFSARIQNYHFLYFSIISFFPGFPGEAKLNILKDQLRYCKWKVSTSKCLLCGFLADQWAHNRFGFQFEVEPSFFSSSEKSYLTFTEEVWAKLLAQGGYFRLSSILLLPGVHSWSLIIELPSNWVEFGGVNTLLPVLVGQQYLW